MAQLAAAARLEGQLLVSAKSPVTVVPVRVSGALPVLVKVTASGELVVPTLWPANVRVAGDRLTLGAASPAPASGTFWELPGALSVMVKAPVRVPDAVGEKLTLMTQETLGASVGAQLLVSAKSPLVAILVINKGAVPMFPSVIGWGLLVVPTF